MTASNLIRCAAILVAGLTCGSVLAADDTSEPHKAVSYADLNLKSSAGIATLYQRIRLAAGEVCQLAQGTVALKLAAEIKACRTDALDRAVAQLNLPALSALHLARTGRNVAGEQYADRR